MKVRSTILILLMQMLTVDVFALPQKPVTPIDLKIERVGGMTHLEFSGHKQWNYKLTKHKDLIKMEVPVLTEASQKMLEEFKSLLVKKIEVKAVSANKSQLLIHLKDNRIENFDYLTQNPNNLIVDLFVSDNKVVADIQKKERALAMAKNKPVKVKKTPNRKPAFAEYITVKKDRDHDFGPLSDKPVGDINELFDFGGLLDGSFNDDDMEATVIEAQGNIYLRFPILKLANKHLKELQSFQPEYEIKKSFSDENKQARNLLGLFNNRSFASFIKAKKMFKKTFPVSSYDEILSYVEADTWIELWKLSDRPEYLTKAMNIYKMLIERYPNSKIAERTLINAGLLAHDAGEYFVATKMLRRYLKNYPYSPFNNHIKIYLGDSLAHLNNYEGAREVMDRVVEDGERDTAAEAMYRIGDIFFMKQRYRRAERAYKDAIAKYPRYKSRFPNAIFNRAEAQFNMAEYRSSLASYKEFFKTFPDHPYSAYALTRAGELINLLEHDKKKAQGFYNEAFFRFRNSMGGTIARMRSLSQRFKDMNDQELKTAIGEIRNREKAIDLHQVDEFSAFMVSDGFYGRKDFLEAANTLINYFQVNPKPVNIKKFEKRISRAIAGEIKERIRIGDVVTALKIIEDHQKSWLSKSRRVDVQFFRANSYEKMKLFDEALDSYQRIEKRMVGLRGTKEEKERKVFEYYPSFDQIYLRQAVAKYEMGKNKEALALLKKVKGIADLDPQSKVDFNYTLSRIAFDNKNYADALKTSNLVDTSVIEDPEKREKFNVFHSEVYEKNKHFDKALSILEKFYEKFKGEQDQVYVLSRLFQLYRSKGMKEKAIKTGRDLLEQYSSNYNLDKERYYLGELYFDANNSREAKRIWKDLTKKSMWQELARNKQVSGNWKNETDKKINRIPAMAK